MTYKGNMIKLIATGYAVGSGKYGHRFQNASKNERKQMENGGIVKKKTENTMTVARDSF